MIKVVAMLAIYFVHECNIDISRDDNTSDDNCNKNKDEINYHCNYTS